MSYRIEGRYGDKWQWLSMGIPTWEEAVAELSRYLHDEGIAEVKISIEES